MRIAHLPERSVLKVSGEDARKLLDGLFTNDLDLVTPERAGYGGLLTPQGKIITDFLIIELPDEDGGGFVIDVPAAMAPDLARRLTIYRLRAKVAIEDISEQATVIASAEGGALPADCGVVFTDPRFAAMGERAIVAREDAADLANASADDYHAHRINLGMPDSGKDFSLGGHASFPHEALFDQLGGVSFTKGCYVGQEVVSRMEHRGTARTRIVPVRFTGGFRSEWGVDVTAGDRIIGSVGSTAGVRGIATLRLDKVADAMAAGIPVLAGGLDIAIEPAPFIRFPLPGQPGFGDAGAGEGAA
ncbi:MAG: folate-binding protein YgfZ [Bosea sp.]|jgi:folate-binding protein YgfZ|nr:folate-binding protein YgfZ [Bosea sp. (in: a-proteobacteria)]